MYGENVPTFNEALTVLTSRQDERCHLVLTAVEIRTHLQQAVKLGAAYGRHVMFMPL